MNIIETHKYKVQLKTIAFNIKKDKPVASINFVSDLKKQINDIVNMPKKYRKSIYHDDENMRDMVFKRYTIIYKIDTEYIMILEIFNQNLPKID